MNHNQNYELSERVSINLFSFSKNIPVKAEQTEKKQLQLSRLKT